MAKGSRQLVKLQGRMLVWVDAEGDDLLKVLVDSGDISNVVGCLQTVPQSLCRVRRSMILLNGRGEVQHNAALSHVLHLLPGS